MKHAFLLALLVSVLLILRQYTEYLINEYGYEFSWFAVAAKNIINYSLWAAFFKVLLKIGQQLSSSKITLAFGVKHFLLSMVIVTVHRFLSIKIYNFVYYAYSGKVDSFFSAKSSVALGAGFFSSFLEYLIIIMLILGILYYRRSTQQQKELNEAKLNALQMQLHPHFLFNTLNSITSLIDIQPKKAQKMLTQLGFLMRAILEKDKKYFITLEHEMEYIEAYLEIEHIRFQDRLTLDFSISEEAGKAQVPALLLQPIVENAIKHGVSKHPDGGVIAVSATKLNGSKVNIEVRNDIPKLVNGTKVEGYGIGTTNVSKRLKELYGDQQSFSQQVSEGQYITAITFPYQIA